MPEVMDTNLVSELLRATLDPAAKSWVTERPVAELHFTAVGEAEFRYGISIVPPNRRMDALAPTIEAILREDFEGRILPFDSDAAREYAGIASSRRAASRTVAPTDRQIAAIARSRGTVMATRATSGTSGTSRSRSSTRGLRHEQKGRSLRAGQDRRPAQGRGLEPDRRFERVIRTRAAGRRAGRLLALRRCGASRGCSSPAAPNAGSPRRGRRMRSTCGGRSNPRLADAASMQLVPRTCGPTAHADYAIEADAGGRSQPRDVGAADGRQEPQEGPAGGEPRPARHGDDPYRSVPSRSRSSSRASRSAKRAISVPSTVVSCMGLSFG